MPTRAQTQLVLVAGGVLLIAILLISGIYIAVPSHNSTGGVYIVNRLTGGITFCHGPQCVNGRPMRE